MLEDHPESESVLLRYIAPPCEIEWVYKKPSNSSYIIFSRAGKGCRNYPSNFQVNLMEI